jgi:ParB family chromosome partitioning protein
MDKKALGKGLSALIQDKSARSDNSGSGHDQIFFVSTSKITPNKYQPRTKFDKERLDDLTASIKEKGVVQPVLVRPEKEGKYELIAGERRLRAVKSIGIDKIPAIVKKADDVNALELSLIENIQREGLNPIEEAGAYQRLSDDFDFTQEDIAKAVGKDRSTVANAIRLLSLPDKVKEYMTQNMLTAGHAKVLLSVPSESERVKLSDTAVRGKLSVRELENLIAKKTHKPRQNKAQPDHHVIALQEELQRALGTKVRISHGKKRGKITVEYYSLTDLERIAGIIKK